MALFERFTERARQVVVLAQQEARTFKHDYIGTEHILLGLQCDHDGVAARVLESFDITLERTRGEVVRVVGVGNTSASGQIPFTPEAKRVLELALREALSLGHNYIGTEHILLGLLTIENAPSGRILRDFDVAPEQIRDKVISTLGPPDPARNAKLRPPPPSDEWFRVGPVPASRRLLMLAAARALDDGRARIESRDLLLALLRDEEIGPLLAELGVDEAAVRRALARRRPPEAPPQASAGR